ncbi:MAG TPA: lipopolysaccharide transport periplasmic protein LptA [Gammaproteobacteria bacterium]|nr:lipopolysaccharide transport periplasmic protein LptA [Gammaproteobacteria bacterium]
MNSCIKLIFIGLLLLPVMALALEGDREQPIYIEADEFVADRQKNISTYRGNVSLRQGSVELLADSIVVTGGQDLEKIVAKGQPIRFSQTLKKISSGVIQKIRGEALRLEYFVETEQLIFEGKAHLWRDFDEFMGDYIEYDMRLNRVNAKRVEGSQERVKVIIQPRKKEVQPEQ